MNKNFGSNALRVAILLGLGAFAVTGSANQSTTDLPVSAEIAASCEVSTTAVDFGTYDPNSGDLDSIGTITFLCAPGSSPNIKLDEGGHAANGSSLNDPLRQMGNGTDRLSYNLYFDSNRSVVWDGFNGFTFFNQSSATPTIYARIPGGQNASPPGVYTDTVTVTLVY